MLQYILPLKEPRMNDTFRKFKNRADILNTIKELLKQEYNLDQALSEIAISKRGEVAPESTKKRSSFGSYFSSTIQQMNNFVDRVGCACAGPATLHMMTLLMKVLRVTLMTVRGGKLWQSRKTS